MAIQSGSAKTDRRLEQRFRLSTPVAVAVYCDGLPAVAASIVDISPSGCSFETRAAQRPTGQVQITFQTPDGSSETSVAGRITWVRASERSERFTCGFLSEDSATETFQSVLRRIGEKKSPVGDRRLQQRRRQLPETPDNRRRDERRGHPKLYDKASRFLNSRLRPLQHNNLYFYLRTLESASASKIQVDGKEMLMFGSNNYLGLTTHPKVKEAAIKATEKFGVGAGAVRLLGGTLKLHNELEEKIAQFKGSEAAIAYSSGYTANLATISSLVSQESDLAVIDEKAHASIIDGCRLSNAKMRIFKHNDMADLEEKLGSIPSDLNRIVIVDGVYSMDGDIAKLKDIYRIAKKHSAVTMVDDAHATGVIGENGRGTSEHCGVEGRIDVVMGTLSKALGGIGGFVAGSRPLINYLKHCARAFVFSAALPPAICASVIAALDVIEREPEWLEKLHRNEKMLRRGLQNLGFNTGLSETAIIPVIIGDELRTYQMTRALHELGIYVSPVAFPAVRRGGARLRVSVMATHTEADIERALEAFERCSRESWFIR